MFLLGSIPNKKNLFACIMAYANKRVIVTGASSGIGRAIATRFLKEEAKVVLVARDSVRLKEVADINPQNALCLSLDLSTPEACEQCVEKSVSYLGGIDTLVNGAGVAFLMQTVENVKLSDLNHIMFVNFQAPLLLMQKSYPYLKQSQGSVVNISSISAKHVFPGLAGYCLSKAALDQLTKLAALEWASSHVRVNSVNPGTVKTNIHLNSGMSQEYYDEEVESLANAYPIGRVGQPEDIVDLVLFLSDNSKSGWMTGQTIVMDGGRTLTVPSK